MDGLEEVSVRELLAGYSRTRAELRRRGVVRTNNAPIGDHAEWLLAATLGGTVAESTSAKSFDVDLPDGARVQVKARLIADPRRPVSSRPRRSDPGTSTSLP